MKRKLISAAIGQILIDRQLKDVEGEEMTPIEQAIEALEDACGNRCNAEYNPCHYREAIDALRAQPIDMGLIKDRRDSAELTLIGLGYTWHGGEQWKPPLGKRKPNHSELEGL